MVDPILERLIKVSKELLRSRYRDGECDAMALRDFSNSVEEIEKELYGEDYEECRHERILTMKSDGTFRERRGCLDCDRWIDPVRLIND